MSGEVKNRMQGMRIRDEFLCPITYELLREPMVASDGHTYEKMAIEKWLKSDSPKIPFVGGCAHGQRVGREQDAEEAYPRLN